MSNQHSTTDSLIVQVSQKDCPSPHSLGNKIGRVLWGVVWLFLFRPSPRVFHAWRRFLLKVFGAKIGASVKVDPSVKIWVPWHLEMGEEATLGHDVNCYNVARLTIGRHATVSQYAFLCTATHDVNDPNMKLISAPIVIEDQAWVCAGAFVSPGVTIETGAVAGARAVVTKSIPQWAIAVGNPATVIKQRDMNSKSSAHDE